MREWERPFDTRNIMGKRKGDRWYHLLSSHSTTICYQTLRPGDLNVVSLDTVMLLDMSFGPSIAELIQHWLDVDLTSALTKCRIDPTPTDTHSLRTEHGLSTCWHRLCRDSGELPVRRVGLGPGGLYLRVLLLGEVLSVFFSRVLKKVKRSYN